MLFQGITKPYPSVHNKYSSMQKALVITAATTPEQWAARYRLDDIPIPTPAQGEILIKILAVGLNPADWKMPKYDVLIPKTYPAIIGQDIAGEVEKVGEGVEGFEKGDRVMCQAQNWSVGGAFQQWVAVASDFVSKIPDNVTYDEAATLPLAVSTAYSGLYSEPPNGAGLALPLEGESSNKYLGSPIVILGGASAVGQAVIQLAKLSGFSPIITTASTSNEDALKKIGATHVLDRDLSSEDVIAEVKKILGRGKVALEYVYDVVAAEATQKLAVALLENLSLGKGGHAAIASPNIAVSAPNDLIKVAKVFGAPAPYNDKLFQDLYSKRLYGWLKNGIIVPNRFEVLQGGLNGVVGGARRLEDGVSRLRLVAHPQET
ncbi:GroES-like protein [Agrocybe pediades]|nr:GroES-like protein [Agrocybe pediades]